MKILQSVELDFAGSSIPITIFAKQFDKGSRYIQIIPLNSGQQITIENDVTARLQLTKPDGCTVINDAVIDNDVITAELTEQMLLKAGTATAEIGLYKESALLSSQVFFIEIKKAAYNPDAIESTDEFNALTAAIALADNAASVAEIAASRANTAAEAANSAAVAATSAAEAANNAASEANTAASSANYAKTVAITAANGANTAKTEANNAATAANSAAAAANTAASRANTAAEGAEKVNISAEQTLTGADITVTDRTGAATTVHIDTLNAVSTWADIRNAVRMGLGATLFPVGYEFTTVDSDTGISIVWVVRGHDHHTPANSRLTHSMTIEAKYVYSNASGSYKTVQYDAQEALYFAENGLSAGLHYFTVANQAWYPEDNGKSFHFTLTQAVPAGGQVVVSATHNQTLEGKSVRTYSSPSSTAAIETTTLTEGIAGMVLGITNGVGNINHMHRIVFGSNNYAQSAVRQWLNSSAAAGGVWNPTNKFDRAPSWATTYNGFMHGLPADFLEVVEPAVIPCRTNGVFECASLDGTEFTINQVYELKDKFFLLSCPEIYGTWDSTAYKDGELLDYYDGLTNEERKKYDNGGTVRYAWWRSPHPSNANNARVVATDGSMHDRGAYLGHGVTPACIIA